MGGTYDPKTKQIVWEFKVPLEDVSFREVNRTVVLTLSFVDHDPEPTWVGGLAGLCGIRMESRLIPLSRMRRPYHLRTRAPKGDMMQFDGLFYCPFATGFATERAVSMKRCASGLSVRFLRVTMPIG